MKKYEWDKALRRELRVLPDEEREQVLDYYNELFEDKRDRGDREADILRSFGSPYDVADKIIREGNGGYRTNAYQDMSGVESTKARRNSGYEDYERKRQNYTNPQNNYDYKSSFNAEEKPRTAGSGTRILLFAILLIVFWIPVFAVLFAVTVASIAITLSGFAVALGGVAGLATVIVSIPNIGSIPMVLILCGGFGLLIGLGFVLMPLCVTFAKFFWRWMRKACIGCGNFLKGRRA